MELHMYDAQTNTVNIDDITTNEQNRKVLRRLSNNNAADFNEELIQNLWIRDVDEDDNDYLPEGAHDMGWLGYFIGRCDYLQKLYIREFDDYSIDVLEPFFRGVQLNKSIQVIDFEGIDLFEGKTFTILTPFLKNNTSLISLSITNCDFGGEGGRLLALAIGTCKSLRDVELSNNNLTDEEMVDIITALSMHCQLKNLTLIGNILNKNGCIALATLLRCSATELQHLYLSGNEINDEGIEALVPAIESCNHLKTLYLDGNPSITTKGWKNLASILEAPDCTLETLMLADDNIDDEAAATFASALTNNQTLRTLNLYGNPLSAKCLYAFSKLICDASSVNATFLSNHTLRYTYATEYADAIDESLLLLNRRKNKKETAIIKILQHHVDFDMMPFFEWEFKVLPLMINWFDRASTISMPYNFEPNIGPRKLSSIYQFVKDMPVLYVETRLRKELEDIKAMESQIAQMEEELRQRKLALEERTKSIMERLGQQAKV